MNIDSFVDEVFNGSVMVCINDKEVYNKSFGYADLPNKILIEKETKFATASAGKVFVAVGILQLIEKNSLRLENRIGDILKIDFENIDKNITIRELLTHTSGIPDYFDEQTMTDYEELWADYPNYKIRTNNDLLPLFINKPMIYPRGERFQYNNTGYVILAMVIEQITGILFDQYLEDEIFKKCMMKNTGYYELDRLPEKCANNYIYDKEKETFKTNIYAVDAKGTGAGGAFTTLEDIKLFWKNLYSYKLLSEETTLSMLSNQSGPAECYGYGVWLKKENNRFVPFVQGCDPGVSFVTCYDKEKELCISAVSNFCNDVWKIKDTIYKSFE